jgi:hypothetical protein
MLIILISIMMVHSNGIQQANNIERVNSIILSFQAEKITYNGQEGFFISSLGWKNLYLVLNDYIYMQNLVIIKDDRIKQLEKMEVTNFKLKTALGITIAFDVGSILLASGLGVMCWNLAKGVK